MARDSINRFVQPVVELIIRSSAMEPVPPSESLMATTAGLIGDLVGLYEGEIVRFFSNEAVSYFEFEIRISYYFQVTQMLQKARKSKVSKTKSMANWATKEMKKVNRLL